MDQLRKPQDLADQLEVPLATLRRWRYVGTGPTGFRVGRHVRYRQSDIDAWIEEQIKKTA